jgi:hypothetical protein
MLPQVEANQAEKTKQINSAISGELKVSIAAQLADLIGLASQAQRIPSAL